jgi:hypothetical protein
MPVHLHVRGQCAKLPLRIVVQLPLQGVAGAQPLAQFLQRAARQHVHQRQRRAGCVRQAGGTVRGMSGRGREVGGGEDRTETVHRASLSGLGRAARISSLRGSTA